MFGAETAGILLADTHAFKDRWPPVIFAKGNIGIYFISTELVIQDDGAWEQYSDDPRAMIEHCRCMAHAKPSYGELIRILAEEALKCSPDIIAGGQRRDWPFSGPVAELLGIPHLALYKQKPGEPPSMEWTNRSGSEVGFLGGQTVLLIIDLLTSGSSCYRVVGGSDYGWIPMIRSAGGRVVDLISVVDRLQGAGKMLAEQGVITHSAIEIGPQFLAQHSKNPEEAMRYQKDPDGWTEQYLREHGALALVPFFAPDAKPDKPAAFLRQYASFLKNSGRLDELDTAVRKQYRRTLDEYMQ